MYLDGEELANTSGYLGLNATVFQAECRGIIAGVKLVETANIEGKVIFKTDNQAVLHALNSFVVESKTVKCMRKALNTLANTNEVVIEWIKAHVGHLGNERADELAKEGAEVRVPGCEPIHPLSKAITSRHIKNSIEKKWHLYWLNEVKGCRQSKLFFPNIATS